MRRYLLELGAGMAFYALAVLASSHLLKAAEPQAPLRIFLSLLPMLPALGVCWAVVRHLRRLDEMQRKMQLEAFGLAFAATALVTFSYGFLENAGFPKLSMFTVWPLMAMFWIVGTVIGRLRYR